MRFTLRVLAIAVLVGFGVAGCSTTVAMSQARLEEAAMESLEEMAGQRPDTVTCEGGLEGVVGTTQRCELTVGPDRLGFTVTVTGVEEEDDWIDYEIEVDEY